MKLRGLLFVAALSLPAFSYAADFPWLTFLMSDNTELSVASDNLELSYTDGNLHLKSITVDQVLPVSQIKSMRFTSFSSGIDNIQAGQNAPAHYYTVSGIDVGRFESVDEARRTLPSGTYIGKSKHRTYKVIF